MPEHFRYELLPAGGAVLCALSGGADSMYLLCRLLEAGYEVRAAHYNHNLRPTAHRDEAFVRDWCAEHGIALAVGSGDVAAQAARRGLGIEECARQMRYRFLEDAARRLGCGCIVTGHHAGDNAETVLMNLIRGCGLHGLTGIPERRGRLVRPMLEVPRAEIERYLAARGIPHVEDETNADDAYARNKVRHRVLPLLEELNPRAAEHIAAAAVRLREDERELERQGKALAAQAWRDGEGIQVTAAALAFAPRPIALRAVGELLAQVGGSGGAGNRAQVLALAGQGDPFGQLTLPGCTVRRTYEVLSFAGEGESEQRAPAPVSLREGTQCWGGWRIDCQRAICPEGPGTPDSFYMAIEKYIIRTRREGDGLRPPNRVYKTIKKWMIEQRVPRHLRAFTPVLDCQGVAVAAAGVGVDAGALAQPGQLCYHVTMCKGEGEPCIKT